MDKLIARDFLKGSNNSIKDLPGIFILVFDDGEEVESSDNELIYSNYFWDIHREYPNTPLLARHHVLSVLKGKPLADNTHMNLLSNIYLDVVTVYSLHLPIEKERLLDLIYIVTNNIHNEVAKLAEEYVTSIDILDFIEIVEYPIIKEAISKTLPNNESITNTHELIQNAIDNDVGLSRNPLVKAIKSKMVKSNQALQCVGVRGFTTEVDGSILPSPIMSNFTRGLKKLYDFIAESRSAAKSLYFAEAPLQDAEYFARRLQLITMVVENISYKDCGSNEYLTWRITGPVIDDNGTVTYVGDQPFMIGKYYLDEETNTLKVITHDDPALYGKIVKIRTVLYCKSEDPHSVCEVCFGTLSKNVSRFANLGHLSSATMTKQTTQSVLSNKHFAASSVSSDIVLNELTSKVFNTNKEKNAYLLIRDLKNKGVKITINGDDAPGLVDILNIDSIDAINPIRLSSIELIEVTYNAKKGTQIEPLTLNISQDNRRALMTKEFLDYLKVYRWETNNKNNFVFDLTNWDFSLPIFKLPEMEYSFSDHSHQIAKVIESNMKNITERAKPHSPIATLQELLTLVNSKLNVNMAVLEVIVYANMLSGSDCYELARGADNPILGIANLVIKNRSLSAAYAYQYQTDTLTSPRSFFKLDRPDSVFDVFIEPDKVVKEYNKPRSLHEV
jgi:hypothetical protein